MCCSQKTVRCCTNIFCASAFLVVALAGVIVGFGVDFSMKNSLL